MKHLIYISTLLLLAALSACSGREKSPLPETLTGKNQSRDAIEKNIMALDITDWKVGTYCEIFVNQIGRATELEPQDRTALTKLLREKYADQMIRCADSIMRHACAPNHAVLHAMVDSLAQHESLLDAGYRHRDIASIISRRKEHDKMNSFSVQPTYGKAVTVGSVYDLAYDHRILSLASSYRAKKPTCAAINSKISSAHVESVLKRRRADFNRRLNEVLNKEQ